MKVSAVRVLKVLTASQTEYMLNCADYEQLHHWFQSLQNNINVLVDNEIDFYMLYLCKTSLLNFLYDGVSEEV